MQRGEQGTDSTARDLLMLVAILVALGVLTCWIVSIFAVTDGSKTETEIEVFGHITALSILVLFTVIIHLLGRGFGGLVTGVDNRISTSKVQVLLWTYVLAGAILSLIAATWLGANAGFDALTSGDFDFEPYLVLLGGPFAAAIGARAIVGSQVGKGEKAKPPGEPSASQAVTDDRGNADLIDCQYLLFNLVAIVYFLGAFGPDPAQGLPAIPPILYVLTGASALGYVSNKAIPSGPPTLASIAPSAGRAGTEITVFGSGLLFPRDATATRRPTSIREFHPVEVVIGGRSAEIVDGSLSSGGAGGDRLKAIVPAGLAGGEEHDVVALNFRGAQTEPVKFKLDKQRPNRLGRRNADRPVKGRAKPRA